MWFALSKRLILTRKTTKITRSVMSRFGMLFFLFLLLLSQSSNAQDFIGWPNFNPAPDTIKNPETDTEAADRPKKAPLLHKQIDWQPWKDMSMYRYRTGSRYAGRKNWEHYIIFESRENVRFSEISYGPMKASDVLLSSSAPVAKIVLPLPSASHWKWNASLYSPPK
jgi:hypothetical protein